MLIVLLVAGVAVILWGLSNLDFAVRDDTPPPADLPADLPAGVPRWDRVPSVRFPQSGLAAPGGRAEVRLTCVVQSSRRLGNCVVVHEDPPGYGFAASTLDAARRARVTRDSRTGVTVTWTTRFVPPVD